MCTASCFLPGSRTSAWSLTLAEFKSLWWLNRQNTWAQLPGTIIDKHAVNPPSLNRCFDLPPTTVATTWICWTVTVVLLAAQRFMLKGTTSNNGPYSHLLRSLQCWYFSYLQHNPTCLACSSREAAIKEERVGKGDRILMKSPSRRRWESSIWLLLCSVEEWKGKGRAKIHESSSRLTVTLIQAAIAASHDLSATCISGLHVIQSGGALPSGRISKNPKNEWDIEMRRGTQKRR